MLGIPQQQFLTALCRLSLEAPGSPLLDLFHASFISNMSGPLQFLNHSDPGSLATGQSKELHEAKPSKAKHLSALTSQKNSPVACFDPPVKTVPTKNPMMYKKRAADPVCPDLTALLVKNKTLLAELRNLQNKLFIKETSLQEMKSELESYKRNNVHQSSQIMSLKEDIKDLEELTASLTRIKSLKNTNIQNLERGNWDLTEKIIELENNLRVHLSEREKAERKAGLLEKKLAGANGFTHHMNMKGQEDSLDSFMMKRTAGLQQEIQMLTKRLEQLRGHSEEAAGEFYQMEERQREQKRPLKRLEGNTAINDFFQERLELNRKKENSGIKNSWIAEHGKISKQLEKDNEQQTLLNIQQNLQNATTQRLEEKIQKLQKQLSDLKLSNKSMKTQLTRVNVLKDKTIEKLRQSLAKAELTQGKTVMKTDNLKTTSDSAKTEERGDKEKVHQMLDAISPEHYTAKSTLDKVSGQQELTDFRETIMKMLGFNMRTADKEIINHLRLIIQDYKASDKPKVASHSETGQDNE
ncbi:coiled-coil domain-containing protein 170-like isoform X2 [Neofelis nebulosa]|uniref:coiled-coil domain-containing protein 170-like isoform X2 n=1 Tax=Neofelis nebulosa TaxID=61452 RepID=UPI00272D9682|nr:coiled-coil domain-containing protein 170-like isoform X2 [Neofelis nebulosa]